METIVPVILAGGTGSRLWPISRTSHPKQLLNMLGDHTLLQETILRCNKFTKAKPILVYNEIYHFQVIEQLKQIDNHQNTQLIVEALPKNTAPAIALAAFASLKVNKDPCLFVMPADHYLEFENENDFFSLINLAKKLADENHLVLLGITPTEAATGYGYIKKGANLFESKAFNVSEFIEKPSTEVAENYITQNNYFWNSGMFIFKAEQYLLELQKYAPEIYDICLQCHQQAITKGKITYVSREMVNCPSISIDYAVMEHTDSAALIPVKAKWSDIGSWSSVFDIKSKDENGNVIEGDVITENSNNCYIKSSSRLVAAIGVEDHVIVETTDSVLIAHKNSSQDIKKIVEQLNVNQRIEANEHRRVCRPWGSYEILLDTPTYKVKKLTVDVGSSLSLQKHKHRSEHWVIVSGIATVTNGDEQFILYPSQSTYIPQGVKHRLSNFADKMLEIIEVQVGDYLGEDDIERFDDVYGRVKDTVE